VSSPAESAVVVTTTLPDQAAALELARALVEARLAACVHVIPITSVYRWQGAVEEQAEWACHIKTTVERSSELHARIRSLHPYQVPEILTLSVGNGDPDYLRWVTESVRDS
jgi:periplasmic divalent cation tolerance protein